MMGALLASNSESVKGRAQYWSELSPHLKRSLTSRWLRWHRRQWEPADGIVRTTDMTRAALAAQRLGGSAGGTAPMTLSIRRPIDADADAVHQPALFGRPSPGLREASRTPDQ